MKEKIYFGDVDLIDTRNGKITTIPRTIFKPSDHGNGGKFLQSISRTERPYKKVHRLRTDTAKIVGETV